MIGCAFEKWNHNQTVVWPRSTMVDCGAISQNHGHHDHGHPWLTVVLFLKSMVNHGQNNHALIIVNYGWLWCHSSKVWISMVEHGQNIHDLTMVNCGAIY